MSYPCKGSSSSSARMSRSALPFLAASMVESSGITICRNPSYRTADVPDRPLDERDIAKVGLNYEHKTLRRHGRARGHCVHAATCGGTVASAGLDLRLRGR